MLLLLSLFYSGSIWSLLLCLVTQNPSFHGCAARASGRRWRLPVFLRDKHRMTGRIWGQNIFLAKLFLINNPFPLARRREKTVWTLNGRGGLRRSNSSARRCNHPPRSAKAASVLAVVSNELTHRATNKNDHYAANSHDMGKRIRRRRKEEGEGFTPPPPSSLLL